MKKNVKIIIYQNAGEKKTLKENCEKHSNILTFNLRH